MRISDWSSDVCSSDLDADDVREGPLPDAPADAGPGPLLVGFRQSEADGSKALDDLRRHARVLAHHPILAALADTCCQRDRKSVVQGKSVSVRVDRGGRRLINKKLSCIDHRVSH